MRLGEAVVSSELGIIAAYLTGGSLDFYGGDTLIASVPFPLEGVEPSVGEVVFTGFGSALATSAGVVDGFRAMSGGYPRPGGHGRSEGRDPA